MCALLDHFAINCSTIHHYWVHLKIVSFDFSHKNVTSISEPCMEYYRLSFPCRVVSSYLGVACLLVHTPWWWPCCWKTLPYKARLLLILIWIQSSDECIAWPTKHVIIDTVRSELLNYVTKPSGHLYCDSLVGKCPQLTYCVLVNGIHESRDCHWCTIIWSILPMVR